MASSVERRPESVVRWLEGVYRAVPHAIGGARCALSSLTQALQHLLVGQGLGVPFANFPCVPLPPWHVFVSPPHILLMRDESNTVNEKFFCTCCPHSVRGRFSPLR